MKKILSALAFVIFAGIFNFCSANRYDNDPDYICMFSHQGYYNYLYLPSIDVQEYNPPHYQIGYKVVEFNDSSRKSVWRYDAKRYNWYTKESFHLENGYWVKDDVYNWAPGPARRARYAADVVFRAAYGMNFYGY